MAATIEYSKLARKGQKIPIINNGTKHPFPSDFVNPKTKETDEYGLLLANAIYYTTMSYGPSLFYNDRKLYQEYINYAIGEQSEDKYKPLLRINPAQSTTTWVGALRWGIKNYATKRVNIAISKVAERTYDPQVDPLDQNARDEREEFKQRIKFYMDFKESNDAFAQIMGTTMLPEGVDRDLLPDNSDELEMWMQANYKYIQGAAMEKLISHHLDRNRWPNHKRQAAFDSFVLGASVVYAGMDDNILPECYRCNPADIIVPPTDREDFSDINFVGHIMRPTIAEFYKMVGDSRPKAWVEQVVEKHSTIDPGSYYFRRFDYPREGYKDQARIELVRFAYKSTNEMVHIAMTDKHGNERLHEKSFDDYKTPQEQQKFKEKYPDRELRRDKYHTIYEGFWVTGSEDYIFRYGERNHQERNRGQLSETALPYKIFAPNIKNNRTVSTMKQMIPVLDELQAYHIKKQHVLANAMPAVWDIDLNALRNADFKWNDKDMSDQQKIEFLFQTGIFLRDSGDRHLPGNNYQPIRNLANSVANEVLMYAAQIQNSLIELDEVIGMNKVSSAQTLRADTGKGTAEIQQSNTEVALDYLYRADRETSLDVIKTFGILSRQSIKYKGTEYYEKIISSKEVDMIKNTPYADYGFRVSLRPTAAEWEQMYKEAIDAVKSGAIEWDDFLDLKDVATLKEARNRFRVAIRKRRKEKKELEMSKITGTIEGQKESNQQTHQNAMELKGIELKSDQQKRKDEAVLAARQHKWKMDEIREEQQLTAGSDILVARQKGFDQAINSLVKNLTQPAKESGENKPKTTAKVDKTK